MLPDQIAAAINTRSHVNITEALVTEDDMWFTFSKLKQTTTIDRKIEESVVWRRNSDGKIFSSLLGVLSRDSVTSVTFL